MNRNYIFPIVVILITLCVFSSVTASPLTQIVSFSPTQPAAEYRVENYSNGDQYAGQFVNGKYNGEGVYTWTNGDRYEGEFMDGQIDGAGRLTFGGTGQYWEGLFIFGQISSGSGVFYWGENGDKFDGQWINGMPESTGILLHANGTSNKVVFKNGVLMQTIGGTAGGNQYPNQYPSGPFSNIAAGSTVIFGHYEQDNNFNNGSEPIQWKVLDIQNGKALLLSVYGLETMAYHYRSEPMTWENCTLRAYLNSNFYNGAFSDQERAYIADSYLYNNSSAAYGTWGGNPTYDHVFLLSIDELRYYFPTEYSRKMQPTPLARSHGAYGTADASCAWWWLRSPGQAVSAASSVNSIGVLLDTGPTVSDVTGAIRPAIWVNCN